MGLHILMQPLYATVFNESKLYCFGEGSQDTLNHMQYLGLCDKSFKLASCKLSVTLNCYWLEQK